ncbi:hypothetical protein BGZ94_010328 [Podila epigama]|nr:hypothetical protein BGZ94_010328 [Podila epigama]
MTSTLKLIRPVGILERYSVTRSNVNVYNNIVVGVRVHSSLPNSTPAKTTTTTEEWVRWLRNPLVKLLNRHALLEAVVGDHLSAHPVFLRLPSIDLGRLVHLRAIESPDDISTILEEEHNTTFDLSNKEDPLWRLVVAPITGHDSDHSFYILFTLHHVIADGRSAMALTELFIQELNTSFSTPGTTVTGAEAEAGVAAASASSLVVPITSTAPIQDEIEACVDCNPSFRTLIAEVTRGLFLPGFIKKALETRYWAGEVDSSLAFPNETQVNYLRFTRSETAQIIHAAKTKATTVQSLMSTASIFATQLVFLTRDNRIIGQVENTSEALVFSTPVSLRNLIPNPIASDVMGNFTSEILHDNIRIETTSSFWTMTKEYRQQVVQGTTTARGLQGLLEHFGLLKFLPSKDGGWEEFMRSRVEKDQHGRKASIKLSNLGRAWERISKGTSSIDDNNGINNNNDNNNNDSDGRLPTNVFTVIEPVFSQSSGVTGSALTMSAATADGVLTVATTWQKSCFHGRERGDLFVSEFRRILLEAIESTTPDYTFSDAMKTEMVGRRLPFKISRAVE